MEPDWQRAHDAIQSNVKYYNLNVKEAFYRVWLAFGIVPFGKMMIENRKRITIASKMKDIAKGVSLYTKETSFSNLLLIMWSFLLWRVIKCDTLLKCFECKTNYLYSFRNKCKLDIRFRKGALWIWMVGGDVGVRSNNIRCYVLFYNISRLGGKDPAVNILTIVLFFLLWTLPLSCTSNNNKKQ